MCFNNHPESWRRRSGRWPRASALAITDRARLVAGLSLIMVIRFQKELSGREIRGSVHAEKMER